jgi:hypothetical protein
MQGVGPHEEKMRESIKKVLKISGIFIAWLLHLKQSVKMKKLPDSGK